MSIKDDLFFIRVMIKRLDHRGDHFSIYCDLFVISLVQPSSPNNCFVLQLFASTETD